MATCQEQIDDNCVVMSIDGRQCMLVTMQNSELVSKLVSLANGDIDLVQTAIRSMSTNGKADLEKVVEYIVRERDRAGRELAVA